MRISFRGIECETTTWRWNFLKKEKNEKNEKYARNSTRLREYFSSQCPSYIAGAGGFFE